ncbi:MAG: methyltransferase domain-containing protein [Pseudomonadales bacterium]|nr:methyltransferase domain-containing protein [Pseudomonadales bacterium]
MHLSFKCCNTDHQPKDITELDARVDQNQIAAVYNKIAPLYDIWGMLTESRARRRAIELADIQGGENILEVAAGTGLAFYELVKRNPTGSNSGIDLSPGMLAKAKKRLASLPDTTYTLGLGDAFKLEQESESIDILVNNYMFDLIPHKDMDKILSEFKRVLKKDGKLVLVNMTKGESFGSSLYDFIYTLSPKTMGGCRGVALSNKLQHGGFQVKKREYYQQLLFPSEVILASKR